jgi:signal transduction histidine kinase
VVALAPLVDAAIAEVESKYRGQRIDARPPAEPIHVLADPDRVQQIVVNLLDNAAKYSVEGRPIRVRWSRQGGYARVAVADRGAGIEPDDFARLFTRFGKLGRTPRAGHVGTGLGLYISKSLVEAMGGAIIVRSRVDRGSVFSFTLPLVDGA